MVDQNPSFSDQGLTRQRRNDEADLPILTYSLRGSTASFLSSFAAGQINASPVERAQLVKPSE